MRWLLPVVLVGLTACAAPQAEIGVLSEQDIPDEAETLDAVPSPEAQAEAQSGGFLARLLGGNTSTPKPEADAETSELTPAGETAETAAGQDQTAEADTELASLNPPETFGAAQEVKQKPARRGLFGGLLSGGGSGTSAPEAAKSEVAMGTLLPYGRVARICDVPKAKLGKRVERFPEKRAKYTLYDSNPGSTALRTFYLTGFKDGCARQFSAAVAILGSASLHEQLRYGLPAEVQPYSATDKAYEDLKVRVCKVPRRKPCGTRINRLEGDTVFVSIYERFGSNAQWSNLLVHDGALLAQDKKGL